LFLCKGRTNNKKAESETNQNRFDHFHMRRLVVLKRKIVLINTAYTGTQT